MKLAIGAACALAFSAAAMADGLDTPASPGFLDLYYTKKLEIERSDSDPAIGSSTRDTGDGYGLRSLLSVGKALAFEGEYSKTKLTRDLGGGIIFDSSLESARLGAGMADRHGSGIFLQWLTLRASDDTGHGSLPGWAVHSRLAGDWTPQFHVYTDVSYQRYKDGAFKQAGFEYSGGAVLDVGEGAGLFADYRVSTLKTNEEPYPAKLKSTDLRLGLRLKFGG